KQVIARIDFRPLEKMEPKGPPKSFYSAIKSRFPIPETKEIIAASLQIGPEKATQTSQKRHEWLYYGKARSKYLAVSEGWLAVEYSTYRSFEGLRDDFLAAVDALCGAYEGVQVTRLGLRYIDNIELNEPGPTDWK